MNTAPMADAPLTRRVLPYQVQYDELPRATKLAMSNTPNSWLLAARFPRGLSEAETTYSSGKIA